MKYAVLVLVALFASNASFARSSAEERRVKLLRKIFSRGATPTMKDIRLGATWDCTMYDVSAGKYSVEKVAGAFQFSLMDANDTEQPIRIFNEGARTEGAPYPMPMLFMQEGKVFAGGFPYAFSGYIRKSGKSMLAVEYAQYHAGAMDKSEILPISETVKGQRWSAAAYALCTPSKK